MNSPDRPLAAASPPASRLAMVAILVGAASAAHAETDPAQRNPWPIPKAMLEQAEPADVLSPEEQAAPLANTGANAEVAPAAPPPAGPMTPAPAAAKPIAIARPVPMDVIRRGLTPQGTVATASQDRAVGLKLGADVFSVSTSVVAPAGTAASQDARIDWRLARPMAGNAGFIWTVATGGSGSVSGHPEQTANLVLGYRQPVFTHLTLISQLTLQGNYVFAPGDGGGHSSVVPEVGLSANLNALADLPFEASFDLGLARQMPLLASQYETRGSAMLRLKYSLE